MISDQSQMTSSHSPIKGSLMLPNPGSDLMPCLHSLSFVWPPSSEILQNITKGFVKNMLSQFMQNIT